MIGGMAESIRARFCRFARIAPLVLAACILGCASVPPEYVGRWRGERELNAAPDADPAVVGTYRRITLKIEEDGSFEMIDGGIPKRGRVAGDRLEVMSVMDREPPSVETWRVQFREDRLVISHQAESIKLRADRNPDSISSVTEQQ
ncbi:MAG: hypothetical protein SFX74_09080 [Fimbriimonadaceae bacterium]|nr:hypothetical protein [Fimbriimonadaceae bacterium]